MLSKRVAKGFGTAKFLVMRTLTPKEEQFITDAKGNRIGVLLDLKTYEQLLEAEEELADIRVYDALRDQAHAEIAAGEFATLASYRAGANSRGNEIPRNPAQIGPKTTRPLAE